MVKGVDPISSPDKIPFDPSKYGLDPERRPDATILRRAAGDLGLLGQELTICGARQAFHHYELSSEEARTHVQDALDRIGYRRNLLGLPPRT